jgi:hypothetical protein
MSGHDGPVALLTEESSRRNVLTYPSADSARQQVGHDRDQKRQCENCSKHHRDAAQGEERCSARLAASDLLFDVLVATH